MLFPRHGFGELLEQIPANSRWLLEVERDGDGLQGYATVTTGQTYELAIDTRGRLGCLPEFRRHVPARVRTALAKLLRRHLCA